MMSEQSTLLKQDWTRLKESVENALSTFLHKHSNFPDSLRDAMLYSLMAGGKRLRAILVLLATEACGGNANDALPAACALEMVHTYSLIHDDLPVMDDDDFRRGQPSCHVKFGEATAVLAGDALLTLAFEVMAREIQPAEIAASCCADLAKAAGCRGMVAGQIADLENEHRTAITLPELEQIHRRKTGCLITSSLRIGARIAHSDPEILKCLGNYGICVGLAFQIADDLLDLVGKQEKMGKVVQKDSQRGKATYPSILGEERSREMARELIEQACQSIAPLGERKHSLESMAQFVLERDH